MAIGFRGFWQRPICPVLAPKSIHQIIEKAGEGGEVAEQVAFSRCAPPTRADTKKYRQIGGTVAVMSDAADFFRRQQTGVSEAEIADHLVPPMPSSLGKSGGQAEGGEQQAMAVEEPSHPAKERRLEPIRKIVAGLQVSLLKSCGVKFFDRRTPLRPKNLPCLISKSKTSCLSTIFRIGSRVTQSGILELMAIRNSCLVASFRNLPLYSAVMVLAP